MRALLVLALVTLAACGEAEREPVEPAVDNARPGAPASVRYLEYGAAGEQAPPAEDMTNPLVDDEDAARRGEALFAAMNCDGCHGGGGVGFVGPSLIDGRWRYGGEDGALYHSIFYGRPNGMPAYGGLISDATVWQLVSYVRSQPVPDVVPTVAWP